MINSHFSLKSAQPLPKTTALAARPQQQYAPQQVSVRELCEQARRFVLDPDFQRGHVWKRNKEWAAVDTMLLGDTLGAFQAWQEIVEGETYWFFMDGHQRLRAILDFYRGKYPTWTYDQKMHFEPNSDPPVEPGVFFNQMSAYSRNIFLNYHITIFPSQKGTPMQQANRFLRIQNQTPPSAAERLNAYPSKAKFMARGLQDHPFWESYYKGDDERLQLFQGGLFLMALQISPGFSDLQRGYFIHSLAAGDYDHRINDQFLAEIKENMEKMACLYHGIRFSEKAVVIAMYQSVQFLNDAGYEVDKHRDIGKLKPFMKSFLDESKRANRDSSELQTRARSLGFRKGQCDFWTRYVGEVMRTFNIPLSKYPYIPQARHSKEYKDDREEE